MNGRTAKKLRHEARAYARREFGQRVVSRPRWWFRLACRGARLLSACGYPVSAKRMRELARRGVRLEVLP